MACKKFTGVNLADLLKRCPANQLKQFNEFRIKCEKYRERVNKYPEFLPRIDWDYYRANVRQDYVKLVDEFEKKYEELNKQFDGRHGLDNSKYFVEVEKMREVVNEDVKKFIAESNTRIKGYRDEIERINSMLPYDQMTMEDYLDTHPNPLRQPNGDPTFWPHTPEEQQPNPAPHAHGEGEVAESNEGAVAAKEPTPPSEPKKTPSEGEKK